MSSKEKSILLLARVREKAPGKECAWFVISPEGVIEEILGHVPPVDVNFVDGGTMNFSWSTCALVGSVIYAAGPTDARCFPGLCSINTTGNDLLGWDYKPVPSVPNSVIAAVNDCLYLIPSQRVSPNYKRVGVPQLIEIVPKSDFIYVYDTKLEKLNTIGFPTPRRVRGCAVVGEKKIVVAVDIYDDDDDEDRKYVNYFSHTIGEPEFVPCSDYKSLPEFRGIHTTFAVIKDKLFILNPSSKKVVLYAFSVYDGKQMLKKNLSRPPFNFVYYDHCDGAPHMVATSDNTLRVMFTSDHHLPSGQEDPSGQKSLPVISSVKIELSEDHQTINGFERINVPMTKFPDEVTTLIDCLPYDYEHKEVKDTPHSDCPPIYQVTCVKRLPASRKRKGLTSSHPKASPPIYTMDKNVYELLCSECQDQFKQEPAEEEMEIECLMPRNQSSSYI